MLLFQLGHSHAKNGDYDGENDYDDDDDDSGDDVDLDEDDGDGDDVDNNDCSEFANHARGFADAAVTFGMGKASVMKYCGSDCSYEEQQSDDVRVHLAGTYLDGNDATDRCSDHDVANNDRLDHCPNGRTPVCLHSG